MNAGLLNRRIQLQTQSTSQDAFGQPQQSWSTVYTCWASIDIQNSQLVYETSTFISKVTYRITIRYTSSVVFAANQRVIYTEPTTGIVHTYNVEAIINAKMGNQQITLLCYELDGAQ